MKKFLYLMVCLVLLSVGALFVLKSPSGEPWLITDDFYDSYKLSKNITEFKNALLSKIDFLTQSKDSAESDSSDTELYKWQDEFGVVHYSDRAQSKEHAWQTPDNLTVMPEMKKPEADNQELVNHQQSNKKTNQRELNTTNAAQLMTDAKNVQALIDNRKKAIDDQLK